MGFNLHASNTDDPPEVRNWRIHLMAIIVSMGSIAMGYDTSVIGGTSKKTYSICRRSRDLQFPVALDSFKRDFGLEKSTQHARDTLQGNIVSTFQAGTFFGKEFSIPVTTLLIILGALLTFPLGEKFGRKKAIMFASFIFLIGGTLMVINFLKTYELR